MNRAHCLRTEASISKKYWPETMKIAAGIGNRLLTNITEENKIPSEIKHNRKPSVKFLKVYGSLICLKNSEIESGNGNEGFKKYISWIYSDRIPCSC